VFTKPQVGEVWFAELGLAEKNRPVLVLAYPTEEDARALVIVAPLTSQLRGKRGEVALGKLRWLPKPSAVNVQGLASFDRHKLSHQLGKLPAPQMDEVRAALREVLAL
jgi:mRNA interferase MazF